jgi:predicted dehydrogenase
MNQGIHAVDLLQWLVGLPVEVSAFAGTLAHGRMEAEDTLVANLRFAHGALGSLECATSVHPGFAKRIELSGDAGTVVLEDDTIKVWQFRDPLPEDDAIRGGAHTSDLQGGASDPKAISQLGHRLHIADLVDAIRENRPPAIPGAEARHAVRLIRAIYQSAAEARPVKV